MPAEPFTICMIFGLFDGTGTDHKALRARLEAIPGARVAYFAYTADVADWIKDNYHGGGLALVGHSFGASKAHRTADQLDQNNPTVVDCLVCLDRVHEQTGEDDTCPQNVIHSLSLFNHDLDLGGLEIGFVHPHGFDNPGENYVNVEYGVNGLPDVTHSQFTNDPSIIATVGNWIEESVQERQLAGGMNEAMGGVP
jgi:hypothetical protein